MRKQNQRGTSIFVGRCPELLESGYGWTTLSSLLMSEKSVPDFVGLQRMGMQGSRHFTFSIPRRHQALPWSITNTYNMAVILPERFAGGRDTTYPTARICAVEVRYLHCTHFKLAAVRRRLTNDLGPIMRTGRSSRGDELTCNGRRGCQKLIIATARSVELRSSRIHDETVKPKDAVLLRVTIALWCEAISNASDIRVLHIPGAGIHHLYTSSGSRSRERHPAVILVARTCQPDRSRVCTQLLGTSVLRTQAVLCYHWLEGFTGSTISRQCGVVHPTSRNQQTSSLQTRSGPERVVDESCWPCAIADLGSLSRLGFSIQSPASNA
nr:hypothetical protein CFP56_36238 [Quercus suber]